jgi:hypothetical protein
MSCSVPPGPDPQSASATSRWPPLLLHMLLGTRILAAPGRAKDWLTAHNATVMAVALVVVGILLTVQGITGSGRERDQLAPVR